MNAAVSLLGGALLGVVAASLLVPITSRELVAAMSRASGGPEGSVGQLEVLPRVTRWQWVALAAISGLACAFVLHHVGWTIFALPPLLLLVGLFQLGYCDLTQRLLPKPMVYALTGAVIGSGIIIAGIMHEWGRFKVASIGGLVFLGFLFIINLINPRWLAFGDVRLSFVVGFGLAWVSYECLIECLFFANLLAVLVGFGLIALRKADRRSAVPYGLYLAIGAALALFIWS